MGFAGSGDNQVIAGAEAAVSVRFNTPAILKAENLARLSVFNRSYAHVLTWQDTNRRPRLT
ncbi:MAG: hypothetical protein WA859_22405, partial [Candidatus Sulfotelmatobacter sp.]